MEQRAACITFSGGAGSRAAAVTVGRHFADFGAASGRPVQSCGRCGVCSVGAVRIVLGLQSARSVSCRLPHSSGSLFSAVDGYCAGNAGNRLPDFTQPARQLGGRAVLPRAVGCFVERCGLCHRAGSRYRGGGNFSRRFSHGAGTAGGTLGGCFAPFGAVCRLASDWQTDGLAQFFCS